MFHESATTWLLASIFFGLPVPCHVTPPPRGFAKQIIDGPTCLCSCLAPIVEVTLTPHPCKIMCITNVDRVVLKPSSCSLLEAHCRKMLRDILIHQSG